ncbi:uncharacterized protein LOC116848035 isoform X1 [Odontomachus brunneus]|uniref:uncharacterized protein LOC116848035 isoform X1 n=1 Tax=Odontomachus brunneus TaxID=486640 RepID=UPI0013F1B132|nr:uncharacterized protein LOC116848035 isoform X1 [Odontomachus brunneus]
MPLAKTRFCKSQRTEYKRRQPSRSGALLPWVSVLRGRDDDDDDGDGARASKQSRSAYFTKVENETWRYHGKSTRCPACGVKDVPIILTKQQKFTSSRLVAFCLLGCWPLCIIPLMMSRDKNVHTLCPHCGHDYDADCPMDNKRCSPKCTVSRGRFNDFTTTRPQRLRSECGGSWKIYLMTISSRAVVETNGTTLK